ncbi:fibronectin type III domain-containing protein [Amycolatopsis sp. cg9]|uniref:fibronectin type III domain-containing protein n=1 Tax=Amycolatopsis sp. cg9 TaxID=3238801 RepID=UPI00352584FC
MRCWGTLCVIVAVVLGVFTLPVAAARAAESCPDVLVLGSRGSGEDVTDNNGVGPAVAAFYGQFQPLVVAAGSSVELWANGLADTPEEVAAQYPAVPVFGGFEAMANGIGAGLGFSKGRLGGYTASVAKGEANLRAKIQSVTDRCAGTRLVLSGYSQGAQVTGNVYRALPANQRDRVLGVALFGDPLLNGRARTSLGNLDRLRNGLLTAVLAEAPPEFPAPRDKVRSYCHALDPICQGVLKWSTFSHPVASFLFTEHRNYDSVGDGPGQDIYPLDAAKFFAARVRPAPSSAGPEAAITPVDGAVPGKPVLLSAGESSDPAGRPLTYAWDLDGSGRYATATDGDVLETSFAATGDYSIGLKVTNDAGQSAVATTSVHVGGPGLYTAVPDPPSAIAWTAAADGESATLTWQPPATGPPAEGYAVVTPDGQVGSVITHDGPASLTFKDSDLPLTVALRSINRRGAGPVSAQVRISVKSQVMVVGDSISQGSAGDFTWRYRFDKHETAVNAQLSLVGPRDDLFDNVAGTWNDNHTYADPAFTQYHDAIWGESLGGAAARVEGDVGAHHPDYLLVLLGINDLGFGMSDPAGTEASLRTFIANAREADPGVQFVFGTVLPNQRTESEPAFAASVADFNARLRRTVDELSTVDSQVHVAETAKDIVPAADLWDGTHPNAQGEVKIAAAFADSLAGDLAVGEAYPRPYPTVPLGPRVAPQLSAAPGSGQADLSWTLSPGATGYYVHTRDVTAGETAFTRLPYPVTGPQWTAGLLTNGHTYEFQLKATKGSAEGVFSNVATVTPTGPAPDAVTDLSAAPGDGFATLSWTPVANATGYYVFRKNVTAGETAFTQLPWPVSGPTWVAELLAPGETYQFQLQAANGDIRGGLSNVATVAVTGATPDAVTNLSASGGTGIATLSWTPVANATGYYVFRKNVTAGETAFTQLPWPVPGPTWVAEGLTPGGTYQFQVQAANGRLKSGLSNVATANVTGPTPAAVTDLTAEPSGDGEATLSWTRVANATGYYVHVKNVSAGETAFTRLPWPVAGPSWVSAGLVPGAHYQYRVQPVNGYLLGGLSNTADVTLTGTRPAAVTDLRATAGNGQATLAWTPVAAATGYYVYVRNVSAGEGDFTQLRYPVTGSGWVASGLTPGGRYEFKLQPVNGLVRGGFSNVAGVTAGGTTPAGPGDLRATPGTNSATLAWTPAAAATGYYVYVRNVSAGEGGFTQLEFPVTGSGWVASGLTPGGRYEFKLQSVNGLIRGGFSNVAGVTAGGITPAGPGNLRATAGDRAVTLNWTPAANASGYYVYVRNATAGEPNLVKLAYPVSGSSWTARGLIAGAVYQFQLRSLNGLIEGGFSAVVTVTASGAVPAGPGNLRAVASGQANGQVALSWSPAANATGYYVYQRNVTAGEAFKQLPYPVSGASWLANGLVPGATYEFQLRSLNGYLGGGYSATASSIAGGFIPRGPTSLRAVRDFFSATLLWTPAANATGYFIYMKDVSAGDTGFRQLPYPVTGVSWTVEGLIPGHNYQFYLQSLNYLLYGDFSGTIGFQLWNPATNVEVTCDWHAESPYVLTKIRATGYPPNRKVEVYLTTTVTKYYGPFSTNAAGEWSMEAKNTLYSPVGILVQDGVSKKTVLTRTASCGGDPGEGRIGAN